MRWACQLACAILAIWAGSSHALEPRPQLTDAAARNHQPAAYLTSDGRIWAPEWLDATTVRPDMVVAADGSGTHRSPQAAIDALPAADVSQRRHFIALRPGIYRGQICALGKAPFTLYGQPAQAENTVLVAGHRAGQPKRAGIDSANPCEPRLADDRYGTSGSASVALFGDGITLAHLTVQNDAMERATTADRSLLPPEIVEGSQAVALMARGDRIAIQQSRLIGHQDTFYVRRSAPGIPARVVVRDSLIAGDVDFIFGNATLVIENSTLLSRSDRTNRGIVLAPSTLPDGPLGFLVIGSRFVGDPGLQVQTVALGRAWDQGVPPGQWRTGVSPNGQAVVRESQLGPHITGWAASTARRPFNTEGSQANRLYEYRNTLTPLPQVAKP